MDTTTNIKKSEVLRYLGYKNQPIDAELSSLVDDCITECTQISVPRYCYKIMECSPFYSTIPGEETDCEAGLPPDGIRLSGTNIMLKGNDIASHLGYATKVAVIAATLGASYDRFMIKTQTRSVTRGLILDACGSEYIENICDSVELEIAQLASDEGLCITTRFSPGYGDFPLEQQSEILQLLNAERQIGLTCTPSYIMLPRKSVTAVIGFIPVEASSCNKSGHACDICQFTNNCTLKKEGKNCGN